jgi:hypothetical protein
LPASSPDRGAIAKSNVVKGQELHPDILKASWMASAVAASGVRRSSSKSLTAVSLTEAALASLPTDQLSNVRAERDWAAVIIMRAFLPSSFRRRRFTKRSRQRNVVSQAEWRRDHGVGDDEIGARS